MRPRGPQKQNDVSKNARSLNGNFLSLCCNVNVMDDRWNICNSKEVKIAKRKLEHANVALFAEASVVTFLTVRC